MAEEHVRARADECFGQAGRLRHQIQVEPHRRGHPVHDLPHVEGRQHIQAGEVGDRFGLVESGAHGDQRTPVVARQREPVVPESACDSDDIGRHGALGVDVLVDGDRFVAVTVAAQIRTDDGVVGGQIGGHMSPHEMGLRQTVQQHHGRTGTGDGHPQRDIVGDTDSLIVETGDTGGHGDPFDRRRHPPSGAALSSRSAVTERGCTAVAVRGCSVMTARGSGTRGAGS